LITSAMQMKSPHGTLRMKGIHANGDLIELDVTWARYTQWLEQHYVIVMAPVE